MRYIIAADKKLGVHPVFLNLSSFSSADDPIVSQSLSESAVIADDASRSFSVTPEET